MLLLGGAVFVRTPIVIDYSGEWRDFHCVPKLTACQSAVAAQRA
jgi:hypothetical protein